MIVGMSETMEKTDNAAHLIPPHGGYSRLVTYKLGLLIFILQLPPADFYFGVFSLPKQTLPPRVIRRGFGL